MYLLTYAEVYATAYFTLLHERGSEVKSLAIFAGFSSFLESPEILTFDNLKAGILIPSKFSRTIQIVKNKLTDE